MSTLGPEPKGEQPVSPYVPPVKPPAPVSQLLSLEDLQNFRHLKKYKTYMAGRFKGKAQILTVFPRVRQLYIAQSEGDTLPLALVIFG